VHSAKLRLEIADLGLSLARSDAGAQAALALGAAYRGERTIAIGFGGVRVVRAAAVTKMLQYAARLLEPWGCEARLELRGLRPAARRTVLMAVAAEAELAVTAVARRGIVVAPAPDEWLRSNAVYAGLSANRRKMVLLGGRDGERCIWCGKELSYRSPDATVDHVVCRSRGGSNSIENLVLACAACNHRRADAPVEEWLERCLALELDVDTAALTAAIRRSERDRRQRRRRYAAVDLWAEAA
jgi:HNH endonuclease